MHLVQGKLKNAELEFSSEVFRIATDKANIVILDTLMTDGTYHQILATGNKTKNSF